MRIVVSILIFFLCNIVTGQQSSIRFYGNGATDIDRIKIPIDNPPKPVDVGGDFTIEFWMKANAGENTASVCDASQWYFSNIIVDRDVDGSGDYGDYGIGLGNRKLMVGVERLSNGPQGVCGNTIVDNGLWHHIAVTRKASNGEIKLFVDGVLDGSLPTSSASGDISYRDNRPTAQPNSDPYLVLGAEKHDYPGSLYYKGWIDEFRISNVIRYTSNFSVPQDPFAVDAQTLALYHFNTGNGTLVLDALNLSNGIMKLGGSPVGPVWSNDTPFDCNQVVSNTNNSGAGSLRRAILCAENGQIITFDPLISGQTITLTSKLIIDRNLSIFNQNSLPVTISSVNDVALEVLNANTLAVKNIQFITSNVSVPTIKNNGSLTMENCLVKRNVASSAPVMVNTGNIQYVGNNVISPQ